MDKKHIHVTCPAFFRMVHGDLEAAGGSTIQLIQLTDCDELLMPPLDRFRTLQPLMFGRHHILSFDDILVNNQPI